MSWAHTMSIFGACLVLVALLIELWLERGLAELKGSVRLFRLERKIDWVFWFVAQNYTSDPKNNSKASVGVNLDAAITDFAPAEEPLGQKQFASVFRVRMAIQLIGGVLVIIGAILSQSA